MQGTQSQLLPHIRLPVNFPADIDSPAEGFPDKHVPKSKSFEFFFLFSTGVNLNSCRSYIPCGKKTRKTRIKMNDC